MWGLWSQEHAPAAWRTTFTKTFLFGWSCVISDWQNLMILIDSHEPISNQHLMTLIDIDDFHWLRFYVNIFCLFKNYYLFISKFHQKESERIWSVMWFSSLIMRYFTRIADYFACVIILIKSSFEKSIAKKYLLILIMFVINIKNLQQFCK